ncbi:MAG: hypothetical protein ABR559_05155, partial [Gemmatimonadota bacterium]
YHAMARAGAYFGAENGRVINVTGPKLLATAEASDGTASTSEAVLDPSTWLVGARDGRTTRFGFGGDATPLEAFAVEYGYEHEVPRALDVVLKFAYDPALLEVQPRRTGSGGSNLVWQAGPGAPGEYWVRLTGTVPAGHGIIGDFPFRFKPGGKAPATLGTVTVYYPAP